MNNSLTISKTPQQEIALDYAKLREEGLAHIESMGSAFWTDYNTHDPGITLLELLCYAITDLGYRTSLPIENLLASSEENENNFRKQFFSAKEILPTEAVSELDLRKLIIDIDGIKNAWLFKASEVLYFDKMENRITGAKPPTNHAFEQISLNGLYEIKIELDEEPIAKDCNATQSQTEEEANEYEIHKIAMVAAVLKKFHQHRPLCEDLVKVSIVEEQKIRFCLDIQIAAGIDANDIYPKVLYSIDQYLAPQLRQYTLKEMMDTTSPDGVKYSFDQIFDGPILQHGFFKNEEVQKAGLRKKIYTSDIISLLMDIEGVLSVNNFLMNYCDGINKDRYEWCLPVAEGKKPTLCYCKSGINFYKDVIPVKAPKQQAVNKWFQILQAERSAALTITYEDYNYTIGSWQNNDAYTSVTKNLPKCYGVGDDGLSQTVSFSHTIKALQLKGFLLFFDQVLTNYVAQLNGMKKLYQLKESAITDAQFGTYFFQRINQVKDIEILIDGYSTMDAPSGMLDTIVGLYDNKTDRKNRLLDHLLSRFAENFTEYVLQMYSLQGQKSIEDVISSKALLLKEYPQISTNRSLGYDYYNSEDNARNPIATWDTENVSGMEHRLARLLGIANYKRKNISMLVDDDSDEGMYVIEHILLCPDKVLLKEQEALFSPENFISVCTSADCDDCDIDPYSFKITVILSAESKRFKDVDFRNYIEKTIMLETPAHIVPRICWWSRADLAAFEPVYKNWIEIKQGHKEATEEGLQVLQQLIKLLNQCKSIYPSGILSDCENPVNNPVILDQTNLGNLKT